MVLALLAGAFSMIATVKAQDLPRFDRAPGSTQLIVGGKPFLILGGELGNSAAGTAAQADEILPRVAHSHANTALIPVSWELIEPAEGKFDFTILDHWIEQARAQKMHLVLLWFGSWKNAFSSYAPDWVKRDTRRFARALAPDGHPLEILSAFSSANLEADARAFRALMRHVKEFDSHDQTVLMVQVENESGVLGSARDHSAEADRLFAAAVPDTTAQYLRTHPEQLSPELARSWNANGRTWREVFGENAPEAFTAWSYARYIDQVTAAGKAEYALPMYVNAQLPAPAERAGEYPSGGPYPAVLAIYRATTRSIDFYSPDIYWPNFEYWVQRYAEHANPLFIPEARLEAAPFNAFYAYGAAGAFGFSPFALESLPDAGAAAASPRGSGEAPNPMAQTYGVLEQLADLLPAAQREGHTRGIVLHATSPRPTQTVALGGYLFTATLARSWPARNLLQDDGALLILSTGPDEFLIAGTAMSVTVSVDVDAAAGTGRIAGLASVEEGTRKNGEWSTTRRLNGDQNNQGRTVSLPDHRYALLRVKLYTIPAR